MANYDKFFGSKEEQEKFIEDLKRNSEILGLITENPSLRRFLKNKGINMFGILEINILKNILLLSINIESYDRRFQKYLQNPDITFFSEINTLIQNCLEKSKSTTKKILSLFLSQTSIYHLKKVRTNIKWTNLFNDKIFNIIEKFQIQHPFNLKEFSEEVTTGAKETQERSKNLNQYPDEFEKVTEKITNEIKNNRESTRFISGMIRALFELFNNSLKPLERYFSEGLPAKWHYQGPSTRGQKCCWIKDYLNPILFPPQASKYKSIRIVFEDWFFKHIEKLRHFESHSEKDIVQDKLEDEIYKVKIKENRQYRVHEYTLQELESYFEKSHDFLLLTKHLVARKFYENNDSLIDYLFEPYKFE